MIWAAFSRWAFFSTSAAISSENPKPAEPSDAASTSALIAKMRRYFPTVYKHGSVQAGRLEELEYPLIKVLATFFHALKTATILAPG
jgi:hypothetical protein